MNGSFIHHWLANAVLVLHVGVAAFVVVGLLLVVIGNWRGWSWVNHYGFRLTHLAAISIVVAETVFGLVCPLTTLEMWLRARAGEGAYSGGFVAYWLQRLLYFDAPAWVFMLAYASFAALVLAAWFCWPPAGKERRQRE